jgi:ketosteroid isomerase-like protein
MSVANVEAVKDAMVSFNERDIDGLLEFADPEVEWRPPAELPGAKVYHGHDGVRQAIADMLDVFGDLRAEPERFIDADDRVIALYRWRGRASTSGISVDAFDVPVGMIATMSREGLATDVRFFITWERALEVAGVE